MNNNTDPFSFLRNDNNNNSNNSPSRNNNDNNKNGRRATGFNSPFKDNDSVSINILKNLYRYYTDRRL